MNLRIIQPYLRDIMGSIPVHHNKANITIKPLNTDFSASQCI